MAQKYIIEVACHANLVRSPMAETIGNKNIRDMDLAERIEVISSGYLVRPNSRELMDWERVIRVFEYAESFDANAKKLKTPPPLRIYDDEKEFLVGIILKNPNGFRRRFEQTGSPERIKIQDIAISCLEFLQNKERLFRDIVLAEKGFTYTGTPTQMTARPDVSLVLVMSLKHVAEAKSIYSSLPKLPYIDTLTAYASSSHYEVPNVLVSATIQDYQRNRDIIMECMPLAITRFAHEKGLL